MKPQKPWVLLPLLPGTEWRGGRRGTFHQFGLSPWNWQQKPLKIGLNAPNFGNFPHLNQLDPELGFQDLIWLEPIFSDGLGNQPPSSKYIVIKPYQSRWFNSPFDTIRALSAWGKGALGEGFSPLETPAGWVDEQLHLCCAPLRRSRSLGKKTLAMGIGWHWKGYIYICYYVVNYFHMYNNILCMM